MSAVWHPDEPMLERLLDRDLMAAEQAAVTDHLAACAPCRATLADLAALHDELATLPAAPLAVDLAPRVLARVGPAAERRRRRALVAILVAQAALTLALAAWLAPALRGPLAAASAWPLAILGTLAPWRLLAPLNGSLPGLPPLPVAWASLAAIVLLFAWLAGNRLALAGVGAGAPPAREG